MSGNTLTTYTSLNSELRQPPLVMKKMLSLALKHSLLRLCLEKKLDSNGLCVDSYYHRLHNIHKGLDNG